MSRPPNKPFFSSVATSAASAFVATCEGRVLLGFAARETPRVLLNFADAAWDEVVRARAEAAEEHGGLLHLCHMTHAAAGRRAAGP